MKLKHQIFCHGQKAMAFFDAVNGVWKCGRCGAKVKVVT